MPSLAAKPIHPHPGGAASPTAATRNRLAIVFGMTSTFMVVEVAGGLLSGSLALIADAGHMLGDSLAIALSYFAIWLAGRQASANRTFGFRRAEILAAFTNAMGLVILAIWIVMEAIERLSDPRPIQDQILLAVALAGLAVNVAGLMLLRGHAHGNLNIRSALWHITGDLLGSAGTVVAALVIHFTGWVMADALIGIGIAVLVGTGGLRILYDSANILLDSVPKEMDSGAVRRYLAAYPDVTEICDLHIWGVSSAESMLTAHLVVGEQVNFDTFLRPLLAELKSRFGLAHMTVQLEHNPQDSCDTEW